MKEITEDYVNFETAKLLKEKGFDVRCDYEYGFPAGIEQGVALQKWRISHDGRVQNSELIDDACAAPTLQMAMKWLREQHHLFIGVEPRLSTTDFYWITANIYRVTNNPSFYHTENVDSYRCVACCDAYSFEEACKRAIKYCLENLI